MDTKNEHEKCSFYKVIWNVIYFKRSYTTFKMYRSSLFSISQAEIFLMSLATFSFQAFFVSRASQLKARL
jgi:hypothetical protein